MSMAMDDPAMPTSTPGAGHDHGNSTGGGMDMGGHGHDDMMMGGCKISVSQRLQDVLGT